MQIVWLLSASLLFVLPLWPAAGFAAPPHEDCRQLSRICVDANSTRTIDGFATKAACWKWQTTHDCKRSPPVKNQCWALKAHPACTQVSQTCLEKKEGVCLRYSVKWACTEKLVNAGEVTLLIEQYRIISDKRDKACATLAGRRDCTRNEEVCVSGPETRNIKGTEVYRNCWAWQQTHQCLSSDYTSDCGALTARDECRLTQTTCLEKTDKGLCAQEERRYDCAGRSADLQHSCGSQNWCVGENCVDETKPEPNRSFGRAAAMMNLLQEIDNDLERTGADEVTIFKGTSRTCRKWPLDLKNCCKDSGFLIRTDLAECKEGEKKLAVQQDSGQAHYVSTYCSDRAPRPFNFCLERTRVFCTFNSRLGRILQEHAHSQLGLSWSDACRGLTPEQLERMNWDAVDLSEVIGDITGRMTQGEEAQVKADLKDRIDAFYERLRPAEDGLSEVSTELEDRS